MKRRGVVFLWALMALGLWGSTGWAQPENQTNSIVGDYYFLGLHRLTISMEGSQIVAELAGERALLEKMFQEKGAAIPPAFAEKVKQGLFGKFHRGEMLSPTRVEFGDFELNLPNLLAQLGLTEQDIPEPFRAQIQQQGSQMNGGRYVERWELMPDGALQMEASFPQGFLGVGLMSEQGQKDLAFLREVKQGQAKLGEPLHKFVVGRKMLVPQEREAWKMMEMEKFGEAARLFRQAAESQPQNPWPRLGEAWACAGTQEFERGRESLAAAWKILTPQNKPLLEIPCFFISDQLHAYETVSQPQQDFTSLWEPISNKLHKPPYEAEGEGHLKGKKAREMSRDQLVAISVMMQEFSLWPEMNQLATMRGRGPLYPVGKVDLETKGQFMKTAQMPPFLDMQRLNQFLIWNGHLWRANGNLAGAIQSYATAARVGHVHLHGFLISYLIGANCENRAYDALGQLYSDGYVMSPEVLEMMQKTYWDLLQKRGMYREPRQALAYEMFLMPASSAPLAQIALAAISMPNFLHAETRIQAAQARLFLLQGAGQVKAQNINPPYPEAPPQEGFQPDPFQNMEKPLGYHQTSDREFVVYSVGPDGQDQKGQVVYDPTNGTVSPGDIRLIVR